MNSICDRMGMVMGVECIMQNVNTECWIVVNIMDSAILDSPNSLIILTDSNMCMLQILIDTYTS